MCNASSGDDVSGSVGGVDSGGVVSCSVAEADSVGMRWCSGVFSRNWGDTWLTRLSRSGSWIRGSSPPPSESQLSSLGISMCIIAS